MQVIMANLLDAIVSAEAHIDAKYYSSIYLFGQLAIFESFAST